MCAGWLFPLMGVVWRAHPGTGPSNSGKAARNHPGELSHLDGRFSPAKSHTAYISPTRLSWIAPGFLRQLFDFPERDRAPTGYIVVRTVLWRRQENRSTSLLLFFRSVPRYITHRFPAASRQDTGS